MWDERYSIDGYLFGTDPADFLVAHAALIAPASRVLAVADGEGRNSVYLAQLGHDVHAMDASSVGVAKARQLAVDRGVTVDFQVADVMTWDWTPDAYDAVVAVFIQFLSPEQRLDVFEGMQRTLRPGGRLLLHGYRPEQVALGTGGPPDPTYMYTEEFLRDTFGGMDIERLESYDTVIEEGDGHSGQSALIDLIATKR
ncbi:MAG TPA: class I SAM-dependent methyltransferase [Ilumatobacteraceae bacterium]|nr:class I SAM-dependent methyltransferase [Ilumatobacteraceae bacterium]